MKMAIIAEIDATGRDMVIGIYLFEATQYGLVQVAVLEAPLSV